MAAARVKLAALFVACRPPCPDESGKSPPWPTPSHPSRVFPFLCRSTALVSDIIAPLHFANDPMQQARSDHIVLAKLRRDVLKHGVAGGLRYGFGGLSTAVFQETGMRERVARVTARVVILITKTA